jgi:hypothetical protein
MVVILEKWLGQFLKKNPAKVDVHGVSNLAVIRDKATRNSKYLRKDLQSKQKKSRLLGISYKFF